MPGEWVRFKFNFSIPEFKFSLIKKDSSYNDIHKIFEITINNFFIKAEIAREFEEVNVGLTKFNILDFISEDENEGTFMFENVSTQSHKNAIEVEFSHHAKHAVPIKINAQTNAEFYIFLNIPCIKEVEKFFTSHNKVGKIDLSYYAEQAKIKFLKYLNRSIDYLETIESDKIKTMNIELNIRLSSPKIMLEDPREFVNKWVILNLGTITMGTNFIESSRYIEGKLTKYDNPVYLLGITNFGLFTIENIEDYHEWNSFDPVEVIDNISLSASACFLYLEPESLSPTCDLKMQMSSVNLYISDYLMFTTIELIFAIQDTYNSYSEDSNAVGDFEEAKFDIEIINIDSNIAIEETDDQEIRYEIVTPESKPLPVSEDKIHQWEEQINQQIVCTFGGFKITISKRNDEENIDHKIIFACLETLGVDVKIANKGVFINASIYRLFIQDCIITEQSASDPMPKMFGIIIYNPKLESILLKNSASSETLDQQNYSQDTYNQLLVKIAHSKLETNIECTINDLRIAPNENTVARIMRFVLKTLETLNSKSNQLDKLKEEYLKYALGAGLQPSEIAAKLKNVNFEDENGLFSSLVKIREKYLMKEKGIKVIQLEKLEEKQTLKFFGNINNVECIIPLEWNKSDAKIMSLTFSTEFFFYSFRHKDYYINNLTNMIFKIEEIRNVIDTSATLKLLELSIQHISEETFLSAKTNFDLLKQNSIIKSRLLRCPKAEIRFDQESKVKDLESDMTCGITILQIDICLGFTDINQFRVALNRIMNISSSITSQNKAIIRKISDDYNYVRSQTKTYDIIKPQKKTKEPRFAIKKEVNTIKVTISADGLSCSFIDDRGLRHQSLVNFDLSSLKGTFYLENGKESAKSYILKKMGICEYPSVKGQLSIKLKSSFHNYESGSDEPLIEACYLHVGIKDNFVDLKIDKEYVNVNLTYGVALAIKTITDNLLNDKLSTEEALAEEHKSDLEEEDDTLIQFKNKLGYPIKLSIVNYTKSDNDDPMSEFELPIDGKVISVYREKLVDLTKHYSKRVLAKTTSFQEFTLRMDATLDQMNVVSGIPIELNGIRSYNLQLKKFITKEINLLNLSMTVSVRSISNGKTILISFESPIIFDNNCDFPIKICPIEDKNLKNLKYKEEIEKVTIMPNKCFNIPFNWILNDMNICYQKEKADSTTVDLLLYKMTSCLISESYDTPKIHFKSQYYLHKSKGGRSVYFSLDLYAFKCKPLKTSNALQYLLSFNPPICIKNMLFGELQLKQTETNALISKLKPKDYAYIYEYIQNNFDENDRDKKGMPKYQWIFQKENLVSLQTRPDFLYNLTQEVIFYSKEAVESKLKAKIDPNFVFVKFEANDFEVRNNEYDNFKLRELVFSSSLSKKVVIYTPYVIINKTNIPLTIGCGKKKNDLQVYKQSTEYFDPGIETTLFVSSDEFSWSEKLDFTTIGVSGLLTIKRQLTTQSYLPVIKEYNCKEIDIGVNISMLSKEFFKTKAITFTPRYVVSNSCCHPIIITNDHPSSNTQLIVQSEKEKIYYFENKTGQTDCLRVRIPTNEESQTLILQPKSKFNESNWSARFEISNLSDFQVGMLCTEEFKEGEEWYLPSQQNGMMRYIRVLVTTKDEATLFINFSDPYKPECMIKNSTPEVLEYKQSGIKNHKQIQPFTSVPFVWDDLITSTIKLLKMYTNKERQEFSIDDIKEIGEIKSKTDKYSIKVVAKKDYKQIQCNLSKVDFQYQLCFII